MSINFGISEKLKLSVSIYEVTTLTTVITEDWIKIFKKRSYYQENSQKKYTESCTKLLWHNNK